MVCSADWFVLLQVASDSFTSQLLLLLSPGAVWPLAPSTRRISDDGVYGVRCSVCRVWRPC